MDGKDISLPGIYSSIESTLKRLEEQASEVEKVIEDFDQKNIVENVLKPICAIAKIEKVEDLKSLKKLLSLCHSTQQPPSPPVPTKSVLVEKNVDFQKTDLRHKTQFPPVQIQQPKHFPKARSLSSGVRYPAINHLIILNPNGPKSTFSSTHLFNKASTQCKNGSKLHLYEELSILLDCIEKQLSKLQEMFTAFSQRVVVPLQTFCKHTRNRTCFERKLVTQDSNPKKIRIIPENLHQCEFFIVETMNKIRHVLWSPVDGDIGILSSENDTQDSLCPTDCQRFAIVKIIPDVIEKFSIVFNCARLWLKRDQLYTENARSGLQRATRRSKKTERMWREARHTHRQLSSEENHICCEIETNGIRLETMQNDIESLREDLSKSNDLLRTVETKFCDDNDSSDLLRNQRKTLKGRINFLSKKMEVKERSFAFMNSRIRSLKADRDAIREKIKINKELATSLRKSMDKLLRHREAWRRRYVEKTDTNLMKRKLESVGLRIPSPVVREKTFVLKTRMENLSEAIEITSDRLSENSIHWSLLCCHLSWPNQFLITLQTICKQVSHEELRVDEIPLSSSSSENSEEKFRIPYLNNKANDSELTPIDSIIDFVKFRTKGSSEKEQCLFMLKLWLHHNGQHASLELLVKALQAARLSDAAARLRNLTSR